MPRLIDADAFWKPFEEGKAKLLLIKSMLPPEAIDVTLKIYAEIKEMIDSMPAIEPEPHWIPTSKQRPPQHQEIWITDVYGDVEVVYRGDGRLWLSNGDNGYYFEDEIIAWMPANVPSPYQPEEEDHEFINR